MAGNGKMICPQEPDTRLRRLPEYMLQLLEETAGKEKPKSRYAEYKIMPASLEEKERIILAHE